VYTLDGVFPSEVNLSMRGMVVFLEAQIMTVKVGVLLAERKESRDSRQSRSLTRVKGEEIWWGEGVVNERALWTDTENLETNLEYEHFRDSSLDSYVQ